MLSSPSYYIGPLLISPHPNAPLFNDPTAAASLLPQIFSAFLASPDTASIEVHSLIRQLGFVSLWFFLSSLLSSQGPYDQLQDALSIDMCNFRQSDAYLRPGARCAAFIPRGFYKSTVFTHGGITWDLTRNPNERAIIVNAIYDKAYEFFHLVQRNFDSNEIFRFFYPEFAISSGHGQSTDKFLILPNRSRSTVEPSLRALGLTGAAEGGHYSLIAMDDLVGLDALTVNRQSSSAMENSKKWYRTNRNALCLNRSSRLGVTATRYALDDVYEDIYKSVHSITGWKGSDLQPSPSGEWDIYYRLVEENGLYLRPNIMDKENLARLIKDDFWSAMTQYYNSPMKAGLAEFANAEVHECKLRWDDKTSEYWIDKISGNYDLTEEPSVRLGSCDVLMTTDLAATDRNMNARTCRSSIAIWAKDMHANCYRIWDRVGFFSIFQSIDYIFDGHRTFGGIIRATIIESNAFQKIIKPIIEREQILRGAYVNPYAVLAAGDKKARIRTAFGTTLPRGRIWGTWETQKSLYEELKVFPMSDSKLDVLDESEKALIYLVRPESIEERNFREDADERRHLECDNAVGY